VSSDIEWQLDVVRMADGGQYLVVLNSDTGGLSSERITQFLRGDIVRALRAIMRRNAPEQPTRIVVDHAHQWFGVADALGVQRRLRARHDQMAFERVMIGHKRALERALGIGGAA
jgi:hypothetical protein